MTSSVSLREGIGYTKIGHRATPRVDGFCGLTEPERLVRDLGDHASSAKSPLDSTTFQTRAAPTGGRAAHCHRDVGRIVGDGEVALGSEAASSQAIETS